MCNEYDREWTNGTVWNEDTAYWQMYNAMLPVYKTQIKESFDWQEIDQMCDDNLEPDFENQDMLVGRVFLGTVLSLFPSGKYHTFWTTNTETSEDAKDSAWDDALESVANEYGLSVECGDDPCDVFVVSYR